MREFEPGLPEAFVHPGELCMVDRAMILRTVLGSCVGIVFWIPRLMMGALCHPMLPHIAECHSEVKESSRYRYVDATVECMADKLDSLSVRRSEVQVKLFGGADVLRIDHSPHTPTVGHLNRTTAVAVLRGKGFSIVASSLGGNCGVQILFSTATGEVRLRRLS